MQLAIYIANWLTLIMDCNYNYIIVFINVCIVMYTYI